MSELIKSLKYMSRETKRDVRNALKASVEPIRRSAITHASFSTQIPGSIKTSVTTRGVRIVAGRGGVRIAELNEYYGNHKRKWRHPVYGRRTKGGARVWGPKSGGQLATPFLQPAWEDHKDGFEAKFTQEISKAWERAGFKVGGEL
ncbi:MAG: hypothetical protein ACYDHP_00600 [Ferrimicrobium sp.]